MQDFDDKDTGLPRVAFAEQSGDSVTIGEDGAGYEPCVIDGIERHCRR